MYEKDMFEVDAVAYTGNRSSSVNAGLRWSRDDRSRMSQATAFFCSDC